ncbi:MAG TPA: hypothetical protein DCZ34_00905 [Clostridiales bacterium]|nr:hypothetical protein [Clostridiales bacterium]
MKRNGLIFSVFCLVVFSVICLPLQKPKLNGIIDGNNYIYTFYTNEVENQIPNAKIIKNGNTSIVRCEANYVSSVRNCLSDVLGESVVVQNPSKEQMKRILAYLKNKTFRSEVVDETDIVYAYDETLNRYIMLDGHKSNIQVAIKGDLVTIGYPIIFGDF